jgi:electron transport complex protein RnfC
MTRAEIHLNSPVIIEKAIKLMNLWDFHGGLHLDGHKQLSNHAAITPADIPPYLVLPLLQHYGEPTEAIVTVGEKVLKGQPISRCQGGTDCQRVVSAPIHAPTSGTVVAIEPREVPHPSGLTAPCIVIETDGEDTWATLHPLTDYSERTPAEVRKRIAQAGIVGLGGAGFPSHLKLKPQGINTLVINGAECEPYITCDDRLMREKPHDIIRGAEVLMHVLGGAQRCIVAVEDNKMEAYQALSEACRLENSLNHSNGKRGIIEVVKVPTLYPTGSARHLVRVLTGLEIGRAKSTEHGIVVHNVETVRAVYQAVIEGKPLISRVMTVTGTGVETPRNLEVMLGTPIKNLIDQCGRKPFIRRVAVGGSMMGFTVPHDGMPVIKTTTCLMISTAEEIQAIAAPSPCIRCGVCENACPVNLLPQQLYWHAKAKDFKRVQAHHLFDCIECGCCAYVCPSHIPLVNYYRYAKTEIRATERARQQAEIAKQRHEFKLFRIQREKVEKAVKHQQKRLEIEAAAQVAIDAAVERSQAKKPDSYQ